MPSSKSPLLRLIRKAFVLSEINRQPHSPGLDKLIEQTQQVRNEYNRRRFIGDVTKAALFSGLAMMLPACSKDDLLQEQEDVGMRKPGQQPQITIIGAGLAGLNCAYQLKKRGISATVFEGSNRVGGRVLTRQNFISQGNYTECGGEFIDTG
ncbi:MAG: FAD-dependent oxidoreductase, partial [Bacteroidota bacterium]